MIIKFCALTRLLATAPRGPQSHKALPKELNGCSGCIFQVSFLWWAHPNSEPPSLCLSLIGVCHLKGWHHCGELWANTTSCHDFTVGSKQLLSLSNYVESHSGTAKIKVKDNMQLLKRMCICIWEEKNVVFHDFYIEIKTILTFPNSSQVRKWTKRMANPIFNSMTRTIMTELGPWK